MGKITFVFLLLLISSSSEAQKSPLELAEKLIGAFRTNDSNAYKALHITTADYLSDIKPALIAEQKEKTQPLPVGMDEIDKSYTQNHLDSFTAALFSHLKEAGTNAGIGDWKKIKFYKLQRMEDEDDGEDSASMGSANIWITWNEVKYVFLQFFFIKTKEGYKAMYIMDLIRPKKDEEI